MGNLRSLITHSVTATLTLVWFSVPGFASEEADLLAALKAAEPQEALRIERDLAALWSKTESASMDFLLKRGRDAMEVSDYRTAIEHLTALTDHAPEFPEGFHSRAMAYFHAEKIGPALSDLEQTLMLNPNHFGAVRGLATIFETLGDHGRAHDAYGLVLDLHPNDVEAQKGHERTLLKVQGREL